MSDREMNNAAMSDRDMTARVCAIAGGSGAGKTTLATKMLELLGERATHITIDWYYRDLSALTQQERNIVNFDHPDSLEIELFADHLRSLRAGTPIDAPVYDFASHTRSTETRRVAARPFVITEGIHLLSLEHVRSTSDLLAFVDVPADIRLDRRIQRDVRERGRTEESVTEQWHRTVAPMHDRFVEPSKSFADMIIGVDDDLDEAAIRLVNALTA